MRAVSKDLGLWGLDAPEDLGGHDLPTRTMAAVHEELGRTCVPFVLPPDSPNLRMLQAVGTEAQKRKYMQPYIEGRMVSAIAISEPGAGGDPAAMKTRAVRDGDQWVLNGRKIWISNARAADFIIVMARVGNDARQGGITSFIVDKDTPGFIIEREIPMIGGGSTYEIVFEDCRIPANSVLGEIGKGYAPMQLRLRTRQARDGLDLHRHCAAGAARCCASTPDSAKRLASNWPSVRRSSGGYRRYLRPACMPAG